MRTLIKTLQPDPGALVNPFIIDNPSVKGTQPRGGCIVIIIAFAFRMICIRLNAYRFITAWIYILEGQA
jgi:hypothetical protein